MAKCSFCARNRKDLHDYVHVLRGMKGGNTRLSKFNSSLASKFFSFEWNPFQKEIGVQKIVNHLED